ncbi:WD40 repeat domain-containing protein [Calothrix sp. UHCC 0171]|uniref:WD40 repeat domain-containing protein n=1 Tax=Calothrix sp. UHCC 0171 TaxID=3110245 RepID=UPI002B2196A3|nr:WD40 repeat domain-containing protein [Calothrix sp. UHCC 0171]MEA5572377.1 WD40 repeat domain-containing protein [Calothrix sp. UHCC 0171]
MIEPEFNVEELEQKVNYLMEIIRQLEKRLSTVEKLLINKNNISDSESVNITGSMNIPTIAKINLSETEILELYNNNSQALADYAAKVAVADESLRNKYNNIAIILEKTKSQSASYWILTTEDDKYWLLPKAKLRINSYNYEILKFLFQCAGYKYDSSSEYTLTQLAKVYLTPSGDKWQLLEPGKLNFVGCHTEESEEDSITDTTQEFAENISEEIFINADNYNLDTNQDSITQESVPSNQEDIPILENIENSSESKDESEISPEILLVNLYNKKNTLLFEYAKAFSKTQTTDTGTFEENSNGIYWIFSFKQGTAYLVPRCDVDINPDNLLDLQSIFTCLNYPLENINEYTNQFKLIQPAKVTPLNTVGIAGNNWVIPGTTTAERWKLEEPGILDFSSNSDVSLIHQLWQNVQLLKTLVGHSDSVSCVAISSKNKVIISSSFDCLIKIWSLVSEENNIFYNANSRLNIVAFHPDEKLFASAGDESIIKLWDINNRVLERLITGHLASIRTLMFSSDGKLIASGSRDKTAKVWDVATGKIVYDLVGHTDTVISLAFSHDHKTIATSSSDKSIKLWSLETGKLLHTIYGGLDLYWSVAFSPNSQILAAGASNNHIKLWDAHTYELVNAFTEHSAAVYSIAFSPDGQTLASGSADKTIKLWDINTGALLSSLNAHSHEVYSVTFSSDGQILASGSKDKTIKIWEFVH